MPYYLWKAVIGRTPRIEIDQAEYEKIRSAWQSIYALVVIEEEWDSVVQNYLELEIELLRSAMHSMVLNEESYDDFQQIRLGFSRRLSNLLQSCRSYQDHTPHHLNGIEGYAFCAPFRTLTKTAYDGHFGYRFMEALRNYAQHCGLPLHGATFDSSWTGDFKEGSNDKGLLRHSVAASISMNEIKRDKQFKAKILAEIDDKLETLDVTTLMREYIESLGGVHSDLRKLAKEPLAEWKNTIRDAIARYGAKNNGNVLGLAVAEFADENTLLAETSIFDDMLLRIEKMMRRNGSLVNLRLRYVTNEIIPSKKSRFRKTS